MGTEESAAEGQGGSPAIESLAVHALAHGAASFDPQHPKLHSLRDRGIGQAPRLLRTDLRAHRLTLASGAGHAGLQCVAPAHRRPHRT